MQIKRWAAAAVALASVSMLGGCDLNLRKSIGLVGQGPDETAVVASSPLQMPLSMPATADQLPAPQPGAPSLVEPQPMRDAAEILTGDLSGQGAPTGAETQLLSAVGADQADANVRERMADDREAGSATARLLDGVFRRNEDTEGVMLDPEEEARRLAEVARQTKNPDLEPLPEE